MAIDVPQIVADNFIRKKGTIIRTVDQRTVGAEHPGLPAFNIDQPVPAKTPSDRTLNSHRLVNTVYVIVTDRCIINH